MKLPNTGRRFVVQAAPESALRNGIGRCTEMSSQRPPDCTLAVDGMAGALLRFL